MRCFTRLGIGFERPMIGLGLMCGLTFAWISVSAQETPPGTKPTPAKQLAPTDAGKQTDSEVPRELYSGKVVLLTEALKQRGIKANSEMKEQVALETDSGDLWPIISDWRGRAFFQDERLRDRKVDLVVRKHRGVPYLQVLMIFTFNEQGERQYTDYWCDICSIPMYEIKDCECCQGPIRLRFQKQSLPDYIKQPKPADTEQK